MGWWKTAKRGDKIVCIAEGHWYLSKYCPEVPAPKIGDVFSVGDVLPDPRSPVGIVLTLDGYSDWYVFVPTLFKPVEKRGTEKGMAILKEILKTTKIKEDA